MFYGSKIIVQLYFCVGSTVTQRLVLTLNLRRFNGTKVVKHKAHACSEKSLLNYNALDKVICVPFLFFFHSHSHLVLLCVARALSAPAINSFQEIFQSGDFLFEIKHNPVVVQQHTSYDSPNEPASHFKYTLSHIL